MPFLIYFLLIITSLFAEELPYLTSECDSLCLIEGVVNAYNGKVVQAACDFKVEGPDPLEMTRFYDGGHHFDSEFGYGVGCSYPALMRLEQDGNDISAFIELRQGLEIVCKLQKREGKYCGKLSKEYYKTGFTNCSDGLLNGESSLHALRVELDKEAVVILGDGTKRYYKPILTTATNKLVLRLYKEELKTGNYRHFKYTTDIFPFSLSRIWTTNHAEDLTLNSIEFLYDNNFCYALGSNNRSSSYCLHYLTGKVKRGNSFRGFSGEFIQPLLTKTITSRYPTVEYEYEEHSKNVSTLFSLNKVSTIGGKSMEVEYDRTKKVKALKESGQTLYTFDYHTDYTIATDARGHQTRFEFSKRRIKELQESHKKQKFIWDDRGQLTNHMVYKPTGEQIKQRLLNYDDKGNVIQIEVLGSICNKDSQDCARVNYIYDDKNRLVIEKQNDSVEIHTQYHGDTRLVCRKLVMVKNKICEREFYFYDKNAILIKKIKDDGSSSTLENEKDVSCQLITEIEPQLNPDLRGMTLPHYTSEWFRDPKTGKKKLLNKKEFIYTKGNLVSEEKTFDSEGIYRFSHFYEYSPRFELIKEIDPMGIATIYKYDDSGNKIYEEKVGSGKKTYYDYNNSDLLIAEIEEHDGLKLKRHYTYDVMGNRISSTDIYGKTTSHEFDLASREIASTDPFGKTERREYDAFDHVTSFKDKQGNITKTSYNLLGKPTEILHPDGTKDSFVYNLQGHLLEETKRDGTVFRYKVDYKGRVTEEQIFSDQGELLKTRTFTYKGDNLISETDPLGNLTTYEYDGAGRKIGEFKGELWTQFEYDSLGRLNKTTTNIGSSIKNFDFLNRVVEERDEDLSGTIYSKKEYEYDCLGNRTLIRTYSGPSQFQEIRTFYNSLSQPVKVIDGEGHVYTTTYTYTDSLKQETKDPLERRTIEFFDCFHRLKTSRVRSKEGTLIAQANFEYDGNDNRIVCLHDILCDGQRIGEYKITTRYNSMNQKIEEIEQDTKITKWSYTKGKLTTVTLPSGITLNHTYDPLSRLKELSSSDKTIHYQYSYDLCDKVILVNDLINKMTTERKYDSNSRLVYEKLGNGLSLSFTYDSHNRCTRVDHNGEKIEYIYAPTFLKTATHFHNNNPVYTCSQECNWSGKPTKVTLPYKNTVNYQWDLTGNCMEIESPLYHQQLSYNEVGKLIETTITDLNGSYQSAYAYDDLDQLVSEKGYFATEFVYDSLNNRRLEDGEKQQISPLNQVLKDKDYLYTYDADGKRITKGGTKYAYDALGRLLEVDGTRHIYDSFGRRIHTISDKTIDYLYQYEIEIGSYHNGTLKEFRLLGDRHNTLAIEIDGTSYAPLTNHRGDIVQLIGPKGPTGNVRYDAFGNFKGSSLSPWLFFGQRFSPETNLYHFCRRDYDPSLGVWLTPDPSGFIDGPNLYAYVHNNPLTTIDPYGLWGESLREFAGSFSRGAMDDTTWGASEYFLGEYHSESMLGKAGYYGGVSASMAVGMLYGGTEAKVAKCVGTCLYKGAQNGVKFLKSWNMTRKAAVVVKEEATLVAKAVEVVKNTANKVSPIAKLEAEVVPKTTKKFEEYVLWQKNSPFRNKTAEELDALFRKKGFDVKGIDPMKGKGSYTHPKSRRQYYIDPKNQGRYAEPNHVDVTRLKNYKQYPKKRFSYKETTSN